jgi:hypothetical protein
MQTISINFSITPHTPPGLITSITPGYETISDLLFDFDGYGETMFKQLQRYLSGTDAYNTENKFIGTEMYSIETKKDENGTLLFDVFSHLYEYEGLDPGHCYISHPLFKYIVDIYISERTKFKLDPEAYAANLEEINKKYKNISI